MLQEFIPYRHQESVIPTTDLFIETGPIQSRDQFEYARERRGSSSSEGLAEEYCIEINVSTPTPSTRGGKTNIS